MRQVALLLFGFLLLLLSSNQEVTSQPKWYTEINLGCSVPGDLPFFYKKTFTPACVKHDVCYYCGQRWGWKRQHCDKAFKKDMDDLCDGVSRWNRWFCKEMRNWYYRAVLIAGEFYWAKSSPSWCEESYAKDLGDPN